jgi:16S rRNA (guanine1207-N2)-methyltransferase
MEFGERTRDKRGVSNVILLGDPEDARREDSLRGGAITVLSRKGLRPTEALLIESLPEKPPERLLSGLDTEGAVALAARKLWGATPKLASLHLDAYVAAKVKTVLAQNHVGDVAVLCAPDIPGARVPGEPDPQANAAALDLIALPFPRQGESILARELIEEAHSALAPGTRLLVATDDKKGVKLRRVVKEVFGKVSLVREDARGVCVAGTRTRETVEVRDHRHTIRATLAGRELVLESRPGVFGHTGLDAGTRALGERLEGEIGLRDRVLDLGCGYGPLGLAAASLARDGEAVLVDSNVRATVLAARNAEKNSLPNVKVLLRADLEDLPGAFDVALANPPYFSNFRIARAFAERAHATLRPGGRLLLVAKAAEPHAALVGQIFGRASVEKARGGYGIVRATRGG